MKAILGILIAFWAVTRLGWILGGVARAIRQAVAGAVARMGQVAMAMLAGLVAMPVLVQPGDLPASALPWTPLDLDAVPGLMMRWKVRAMTLDGGLCTAALAQSRAKAVVLPDHEHSDACHIRHRVRLTSVSRARMAPVETRCEIAARLYLWEQHVLQPAARRHLGAGVARIEHFSSYSCRGMRTSRGVLRRMSQHATANAFDIAGFVLTDGRRVSLRTDWTGGGSNAAFLRAARDGLCRWFNVTLSPDYNALHADHFHVDMGPFLSCR